MQYRNKIKDWTGEAAKDIVVYHSDDWTDYEHTPEQHRQSWPYMEKPSDFHIEAVLYDTDPDLDCIIVIVHRQGERA